MRTIAFSPPFLTNEDILAVTNVLQSGWITSGSVGEEFASLLKEYTKAHSLILMNSATASLFLALKTLGIGKGDEVITTPYTFAATANVIYHTGAKIVFADVKKDSFYIDTEEIYKKITTKTKAIIPVDFSTKSNVVLDFSFLKRHFTPSNKFQEALKRPLVLIDSAHALGSRFLDNTIDMAAYSFHAVKNLTTAEGGALAVNSFGDSILDQEYQKMILAYTLHGQDRSARDKFVTGSWEYDILLPGYKYNMPDTLAALGMSQFKRYENNTLIKRRELFRTYVNLLKNNHRVIMDESAIFHHIEYASCHLFPLRIQDFTEEQRNSLITFCNERGVTVNVHYKPLVMMSAYKHYNIKDEFENSYNQYCNEISLPLHMGMDEEDITYVSDVVLEGIYEVGN